MSYPQRGDLYLVNLDPTVGHEIKKTRPAVIISNNIANQYSPIVIIAAITSRSEPKFDEVAVKPPEGGLEKPSVILPNQIRSVDKKRLIRYLGTLSEETIRSLDTSLKITSALVKF